MTAPQKPGILGIPTPALPAWDVEGTDWLVVGNGEGGWYGTFSGRLS